MSTAPPSSSIQADCSMRPVIQQVNIQYRVQQLEQEKQSLLKRFKAIGIDDPYHKIEFEFGTLPPSETLEALGIDKCDAKTQNLLREIKLAVEMCNNVKPMATKQATTTFAVEPPSQWEVGASDRSISWAALSVGQRAAYLEIDLRRCADCRLQVTKEVNEAAFDKVWTQRIWRVREIDIELGKLKLRMTPRKLRARLQRAMWLAKEDPIASKRQIIHYTPPAKKQRTTQDFDRECIQDSTLLAMNLP